MTRLSDLLREHLAKVSRSLARAFGRVWGDAFAFEVVVHDARDLRKNSDVVLSRVGGGKPAIIYQSGQAGEVKRLFVIEFDQLAKLLGTTALSVSPENEDLTEEAWRVFMASPEHLALSISEPLDVCAAQGDMKHSPGLEL